VAYRLLAHDVMLSVASLAVGAHYRQCH